MKNTVCANGLSARMIFRKREDGDVLTAVHVLGEERREEDEDDTSGAM